MKTVRRDWLLRQVQQGKVVMVGSYHFDDMFGASRQVDIRPVRLAPTDWHDRKDGVVYIRADEFSSHSGSAWRSDNGIVTLRVHSNSSYDFQVIR